LLKAAPEEYSLQCLRREHIPASWKLTLFRTLTQKLQNLHSIQTNDFTPIAHIRLFYKVVNGQWSTLYAPLGSLFQAQGKCETISVILQGVRLYAFTSHRKYLGVGIA